MFFFKKRAVSERLIDQGRHQELYLDSIKISPDNGRIAYVVVLGRYSSVTVVDGKDEKPYNYHFWNTLIFSPDSKRIAYAAGERNERFVVVDGKEDKEYDDIGENTPIFSPDSKRVAYIAKKGNNWIVGVDGKEEKPYEAILKESLLFSPDSERVAYAALLGNKWFAVVDGKEERPYDNIEFGSLIFSPDGNRMAYTARLGDKWFVVVDGKEEKQYDVADDTSISSPKSIGLARVDAYAKSGLLPSQKIGKTKVHPIIFSPDSKQVAYAARLGYNRWAVILDGKEEKPYDLVFNIGGSRIVFDSSDSFHYLVRKGYEIYLVEEKMKPK